MSDDLRLTLMTFPQHWDGVDRLRVNVLLLPSIAPIGVPLIGAPPVPAFADHVPVVELRLSAGPGALPVSAGSQVLTAAPFVPAPPHPAPDPPAGFALLAARVTAAGATIGTPPSSTADVPMIRKALPASYLAAGGAGPDGRTTTTEEEFSRYLRCRTSPTKDPPAPRPLAWAEVIAYAMRQPEVATWLGLRTEHTVTLTDGQVSALRSGGYLFAALAGTDPWAVAAAAAAPVRPVRGHAARIPALESAPRPLFGAMQFPVDGPPVALDDAVATADAYADGFARLVHCDQPTTADATAGQGALPPGIDTGLQLGWDDHQVVAWLNDSLLLLGARRRGELATTATPALGVLGYRVDAADVVGGNVGAWHSLVDTEADLGAPLGTRRSEAFVSPVPARPGAVDAADEAWLPRFFATWRGGSLCEPDDVPRTLTANGHQAAAPASRRGVGTPPLLSYGHTYAFRVRLADLSGGGPDADAQPVDPAPGGVGTHRFRRHVPAKSPGLVREGTDPAAPTALVVTRPMITYPEVLFTALGATATDRAAIRDDVIAQAQAPVVAGAPPVVAGLPDPDVDHVDIEVAVRALLHDPAAERGPFVAVYTARRSLAEPAGTEPLRRDPGTRIGLEYVDVPDLTAWDTAALPVGGAVAVPRGRDVRLTVRPALRGDGADAAYFAPPALRRLGAALEVRCEPTAEPALLVPAGDQPTVRALRITPPPGAPPGAALALLAEQLGVDVTADGLAARGARRTVFAASAGLRHEVSPDGERLRLAAPEELVRNWVVAIVVDVARDWTWAGLTPVGVEVQRADYPAPQQPAPVTGPPTPARTVGAIAVPRVLGPLAAAPREEQRRRGSTRLVFLDVVDPHGTPTAPGGFPQASTHAWRLSPARRPAGPLSAAAGELAETWLTLTLPIAVPPAQIPALASVGIAQSPYEIGPGYASTAPRAQGLWLELAEPVDNAAGDALYARVLAHGADPLLYPADPRAAAPAEPPLPVGPEPVRIVLPNPSADRASEDAMVRLEQAAGSDRHYLLPLPPGVSADDPDLFGFYSYELRVGHAGRPGELRWWSTAAARFGPPRRVVGLQHPPPPLVCHGVRLRERVRERVPAAVDRHAVHGAELILLTATYATPSHGGRRMVSPEQEPRTLLWFCVYAQVAQADAAGHRNVLVADLPGRFLSRRLLVADDGLAALMPSRLADRAPDRTGFALLRSAPLGERLGLRGLPRDASLSALAVELLPAGTGGAVGIDPRNPAAGPTPLTDAGDADEFPFGRILRVSPLTPIRALC